MGRLGDRMERARTVRSDAVAAIIDADLDAPHPWLASRFVTALSLSQAVRTIGPLDGAAAGLLALRLAHVLTDLHGQGVAHSDLKPSDVLLSADGPHLNERVMSRCTGTRAAEPNAVRRRHAHHDRHAPALHRRHPERDRRHRAGPRRREWLRSAPPDVAQLGERSNSRDLEPKGYGQVHTLLTAAGVQVPTSDLFGPGGGAAACRDALAVGSRSRVGSLLGMITALDFEIDTLTQLINQRLRTDPGYRAIQQIPGVGRCSRPCSSPRSVTSPASAARSSSRPRCPRPRRIGR
jgi:serine/threonine protein kinase